MTINLKTWLENIVFKYRVWNRQILSHTYLFLFVKIEIQFVIFFIKIFWLSIFIYKLVVCSIEDRHIEMVEYYVSIDYSNLTHFQQNLDFFIKLIMLNVF